ncbi:MAG: aminopeptidase P family protein [Betaproteobacteria bacterium]|nr:aminopeptidase P family protein [Betaproteobacteria bacterium]
MSRESYLDLERFCTRMSESGLAAVVAASPNAVFHTSGCLIITHNPIRDRLAFCVTTADGRQSLVVCKIEESHCEHDSWVRDIRTYIEFKKLPTHLLAETLADLGLSDRRIGLELDYLRESYYRELKAVAPALQFVPADTLLAELRERKPATQVAQMRKAAENVSASIDELFREPLIGSSERQIRARLRRKLAERGADGSYLVVATGPNVAIPEHRAGDRVLRAGDPLALDAAVTFDGYVAEAAVTRIAGSTSAGQPEAGLEAAYRAAARELKAGVRAADVYRQAATAATKTGGSLLGDSVGYGVSFGGREPPFLATGSARQLASGMTIALDVAYQAGAGLVLRKKGMWVLSENGATELTASS